MGKGATERTRNAARVKPRWQFEAKKSSNRVWAHRYSVGPSVPIKTSMQHGGFCRVTFRCSAWNSWHHMFGPPSSPLYTFSSPLAVLTSLLLLQIFSVRRLRVHLTFRDSSSDPAATQRRTIGPFRGSWIGCTMATAAAAIIHRQSYLDVLTSGLLIQIIIQNQGCLNRLSVAWLAGLWGAALTGELSFWCFSTLLDCCVIKYCWTTCHKNSSYNQPFIYMFKLQKRCNTTVHSIVPNFPSPFPHFQYGVVDGYVKILNAICLNHSWEAKSNPLLFQM